MLCSMDKSEREAKKAKKEAEAFAKKVIKPFSRLKTDKEQFAETTVQVDVSLIETCKETYELLQGSLSVLGVSVQQAKLDSDCSVTWRRTWKELDEDLLLSSAATCFEELPENTIIEKTKEEDIAIVLIHGPQFIQWVQCRLELSEVARYQRAHGDKRLAIMVQGLHNAYKQEQRQQQKAFRQNVLASASLEETARVQFAPLPQVSTKQLVDMALIRLQLELGVHIYTTSDKNETANMLVALTKAVALAPTRELSTEFAWCTDGLKKASHQDEIWKAQLTCFPNISDDVANAIAQAYPTFSDLYELFRTSPTRQEAIKALANVQVVRVSSCRRVGPALAERIYTAIMSRDSNACLP